jgi:hypothetical protein
MNDLCYFSHGKNEALIQQGTSFGGTEFSISIAKGARETWLTVCIHGTLENL